MTLTPWKWCQNIFPSINTSAQGRDVSGLNYTQADHGSINSVPWQVDPAAHSDTDLLFSANPFSVSLLGDSSFIVYHRAKSKRADIKYRTSKEPLQMCVPPSLCCGDLPNFQSEYRVRDCHSRNYAAFILLLSSRGITDLAQSKYFE